MMKTLFISDLHLEKDNQLSLQNFYDFLHLQIENKQNIQALYILGDFFEAYIGDEDRSDFKQAIIAVLKKLSIDIPLYLMPGNRDFLIGQQFARQCGAKLLKDPSMIDLYGVKTLLTHGDLLCTGDKSYQIWRKFSHSAFVKACFLKLPLNFRQKIAAYIRNKSKAYTAHHADNKIIMDVCQKTVDNFMHKYPAKQIIHGHTHRAFVHHEKNYTRFVLPDWHPKGGMLLASPHKIPELVIWD